ncbi:MAG: hypothetical protein JW951_03745 [Lentisphaerae bacterium]|nr:hypothetical protein [Lentisphaerota bacterium]
MKRWRHGARLVLALAVGAALVLLLFQAEHARAGGGRLVHADWAATYLWLVPLFLLLRRLRGAGAAPDRQARPALVLFAFLLLFLVSGAVQHPWFYFLDWTPDCGRNVGCLDAGLSRFVLLTALLTPFLLRPNRRTARAVLLILVASQLLCAYRLIEATGGRALYRDDHPSFMFRLWEYGRTFPRLITYNPYWSGGVVNFVGTTSGTGAMGLPLWPLWRFVRPDRIYTYAVAAVYIGAMPWLAVASLRMLGANRTAAYAAGALALGVSRHYFLWMLHFGTVGAVFSSFFLLPTAACLYRIVWRGDRSPRLFAGLVVFALLLLQWPPGALMGATLGLSLLAGARRWSRRLWGYLLAAGAVVLLLYARPLWVILGRGDALMAHVMESPGAGADLPQVRRWLADGWSYLWSQMIEGRPLLIFLGIGGLAMLPYRAVRRGFGPVLLCLALIAAWGRGLRPNLQLGRMAIPFFFIAIVPAALWIGRLLRTGGPGRAWVRGALLALLLLGGVDTARLYAGRGHAPYTVLTEEVSALAAWIREHVPAGGRVMFAGRCVHFYGRGHVAYLPALTGREMMACDYYAFPPRTVEYNYPPPAFRRPETRIQAFCDLYNVTHIMTYHDNWKACFRRHPDVYEEIDPPVDWERLAVFRVKRASNLFLKGSGTVRADFNRLDVRLDAPRDEAVLKYNWAENLRAPGPVELFPYDGGDGVRLIGVRGNGVEAFTIRYAGWL